MRIVFNLHNVGLGNNGGSRTIIRCAETLGRLGEEVILFSNIKSRYSWHIPENVTFVNCNDSPKSDIVIATGHGSVQSVCESIAKIKLYYLRGYEVWITKPQCLISHYKKLKCIVCSEWLYNMLKKHNINATLLYPGLDFEWFYDLDYKRKGIGGLYSDRHTTKRHNDVITIANAIGCDLSMLNRDIKHASSDQARKWYNGLKVWFAPTELEGLHNPPMEAALCGCALVCTDHPKSGMSDYAIHSKTAMVYPARNLEIAAKYIRILLKDEDMRKELNVNMVNLLRSKICSRETNMQKFLNFCRGNDEL